MTLDATNFFAGGFRSTFAAGDFDLAGGCFLVPLPDWLPPLPLPLPLLVCWESLLWCFSSSESGTSTNRAVGLGPELEGPLGFFRIG